MSYSSRQIATMFGITPAALSKYIKLKKVPAPATVSSGAMTIYAWTDEDVQKLRELLPNLPDGRKTRHQKKEQEKKQITRKPKSKP